MMHLMSKDEKAAQAEKLAARWSAKDHDAWVQYYSRREYIAFDDGTVVKVDRPSIDSEIWYDDECADPLGNSDESRKEGFIRYNLDFNFKDFNISEWREESERLRAHGCCSGRHLDEPFVAMWPMSGECYPVFMACEQFLEDDEKRGMVRRPMTADEREQLMAIFDQLREGYAKRLETYWKRYGDKVASHGYWANR